MKSLFVFLLMVFALESYAEDRHHDKRYSSPTYRDSRDYIKDRHHNGPVRRDYAEPWIGPLLLGGIFGYAIGRESLPPPPVVRVIPPPYYNAEPDYIVSIEYDPECRCYVQVLRQVGWR